MNPEDRDRRRISAFGRAFVFSAFGNLALVVAKEMHGPLKDWMKGLTGHHWATHGIAVLAIFLLAALVFPARARSWDALRRELVVWCGVGTGGILVFYLLHA